MIEIKVPDMTCGHCVSTITKSVKALDASASVDIVLAEHRVRVEGKASREELIHCIAEAGFTPQVA